MIDIHTHVLPGIDDGAQTLTDSIAMLKQAEAEGIQTIVASPHHQNGRYINRKEEVIKLVKELNEELLTKDISINVLPAQEVRLFGELIEDYQKGEILPINNGKYILIEFPSNSVPRFAKQVLFDIQLQGLIPIIVHPERNQEIIENPDRLYELIEAGALSQVTAGSLIGNFGKNIMKFSYQMIDANLTHFVASDAHNITSRSFNLQRAYEAIQKRYNTDLMYQFMGNAELMINGKNIYQEQPKKVVKKRFLGIF